MPTGQPDRGKASTEVPTLPRQVHVSVKLIETTQFNLQWAFLVLVLMVLRSRSFQVMGPLVMAKKEMS